jgi:hypothetical protein
MVDFCLTFDHDGEKSALAGEGGGGGGARPPPFTLFTITYKVAEYARLRAVNSPPISSLPLYVLCGTYQVD